MSIQYQEPFKAFRFLVEVENGGAVVAAFSQFSGVKMEVETIQAAPATTAGVSRSMCRSSPNSPP